MKVAFVSTFPPSHCGIGRYTRHLCRGLHRAAPEIETVVAVERQGTTPAEEPGIRCELGYLRAGDYGDDVVRTLDRLGPDVAHFQHAPDMFGEDDRFLRLLARLAGDGLPTVVTFHTVQDPMRLRRRLLGQRPLDQFYRRVGEHAGQVIVHHHEGMADRLLRYGIEPEKVDVIPHGTVALEPPPREQCRDALGLPRDAVVFTFFGSLHVLKNVHTVVEAFARAAATTPNAVLLVAGKPWDLRWYNRLYAAAIGLRARMSDGKDRTFLRIGFVPEELVATIYGATDVVLLPHLQAYGSASGVFHQAIGAGCAVLCARAAKFADGARLLAGLPEFLVPPADVDAWAHSMHRIAGDEGLRVACREAVREYAAQTSWPNVAGRHAEVYRKLAGPRVAEATIPASSEG